VAEIDVGGATLSEVARRHGVHANVLFRWRRDLGSVVDAPPRGARAGAAAAAVTTRFVPVTLAPPSAPADVPSGLGTIEIVLAGGRTVRVGADVDTAALVRIVAALEACR
jgi:transposase